MLIFFFVYISLSFKKKYRLLLFTSQTTLQNKFTTKQKKIDSKTSENYFLFPLFFQCF